MALLEISAVSKKFGGLQAVDNVSCNFVSGKVSGVIGPNGAGKTTLFNLITGFLQIDSGTVCIDGKDITNIAPYKIVNYGITRSFQLVRVFPRLTLIDNVLMGCTNLSGNNLFSSIIAGKAAHKKYNEMKEKARSIISYMGLSNYENSLANDLSYGQQKLVEIGRALISQPQMLLLDEPLAGLNVKMIDKMIKVIDDIKRDGKGVVIIEHNMEVLIDISDQITVLHLGKVLMSDSPANVIKNHEVIDSYLNI